MQSHVILLPSASILSGNQANAPLESGRQRSSESPFRGGTNGVRFNGRGQNLTSVYNVHQTCLNSAAIPPRSHQVQRRTWCLMSLKQTVEEKTKDLDFKTCQYEIAFETTLGDIRLKLLPDHAPNHCRNMIGLARAGFYNQLTIHRVIDGFMIQGGCPQGTGTGGPGYQIAAEFNRTPHEAGVLSMARSNDPNSAGSQFFICLERHDHLDGKYTAFGKTVDAASLAVVRKIGSVPTLSNDRPKTPVQILSVTVFETKL